MNVAIAIMYAAASALCGICAALYASKESWGLCGIYVASSVCFAVSAALHARMSRQ